MASMPVGGQNRALLHRLPPPLHLTRHFQGSHRAPSTLSNSGPWALRTGQGVCCVVNVSPPLFQFPHPLYRPSVFPRPPDAANTGSAHFKSLRSPALISTPQNARLAFITNLAGLFHLTHASAATDQGAGRHSSPSLAALLPFSPTRPSKSSGHAGARRLFLRLE